MSSLQRRRVSELSAMRRTRDILYHNANGHVRLAEVYVMPRKGATPMRSESESKCGIVLVALGLVVAAVLFLVTGPAPIGDPAQDRRRGYLPQSAGGTLSSAPCSLGSTTSG